MTKIYVSHPFGGLAKNKKNADSILKWLQDDMGVFPIKEPFGSDTHNIFLSPIHILGHLYDKVDYDTGISWCIDLLSGCDAIIMCNGWENSTGCNLELAYAKAHNIRVIHINELKAAKLTKLAVDAGMNKGIAALAGVATLQALNKKAKEDLQRERAKSVN
jgi:hypothetical protein